MVSTGITGLRVFYPAHPAYPVPLSFQQDGQDTQDEKPLSARRPLVLPGLMRGFLALLILFCSPWAMAQLPLNQMAPHHRAVVEAVVRKPDFTFETHTDPVPVRFDIMEKLFDHPRLAAAMWRHCQFVPSFYAFEEPGRRLTIEDGQGLAGTLTLVHRQYGLRVYLVDGRVEKGRMGNPFAVGARMVVMYRYWEGPKGFQSYLRTWTTLDSALLGFISKPFKGYIKRRQEEFIAYINGNIAKGGEFAQIDPQEFREPIRLEGDPIAIRQFEQVFGNRGHMARHRR